MSEPASEEDAAAFKRLLAVNPDLRAKVRDVLASVSKAMEAYKKLPLEVELELWKAADEATRE